VSGWKRDCGLTFRGPGRAVPQVRSAAADARRLGPRTFQQDRGPEKKKMRRQTREWRRQEVAARRGTIWFIAGTRPGARIEGRSNLTLVQASAEGPRRIAPATTPGCETEDKALKAPARPPPRGEEVQQHLERLTQAAREEQRLHRDANNGLHPR